MRRHAIFLGEPASSAPFRPGFVVLVQSQFPPQRTQAVALLMAFQSRRLGWRQRRRPGFFEGVTAQQALLDAVVLLAKQWVAESLRLGSQRAPACSAAGVVDGRMTPPPGRLRRCGPTRFQIGFAGARQVAITVAAALDHGAQVGQVLAVLDRLARTAQNDRGTEGAQSFQPQLLDLAQLVVARPRRVVLVVVVEPEQREDLVDGIDQLGQRRFSRPSCGRGGPARGCAPGSCRWHAVGSVGHGWAPAS